MLRFSDEELSALRIEPLFGCLPADPTHRQPHSVSRRRLLFRLKCLVIVTRRKVSGQECAWEVCARCKDNINP